MAGRTRAEVTPLILDTHILLWWIQRSPRLGPQIIRAIEASDMVLYSAISILEIELKKTRLGNLPPDYLEIIQSTGFHQLKLSEDEVVLLPPATEGLTDPFDRVLIAQAARYGYKLVTADRRILEAAASLVLPA